jgi:PPOX class probable F420-dependent enzyme
MEDKFRGFLATTGKNLTPRVVPVCFGYTRERIYIPIDRKPKKTEHLARTEDIRQNPNVSFIVDSYSNDWRKLSYMLVFAEAYIVNSNEEKTLASSTILKRYPQYDALGKYFFYLIGLKPKRVKLWYFSGKMH